MYIPTNEGDVIVIIGCHDLRTSTFLFLQDCGNHLQLRLRPSLRHARTRGSFHRLLSRYHPEYGQVQSGGGEVGQLYGAEHAQGSHGTTLALC